MTIQTSRIIEPVNINNSVWKHLFKVLVVVSIISFVGGCMSKGDPVIFAMRNHSITDLFSSILKAWELGLAAALMGPLLFAFIFGWFYWMLARGSIFSSENNRLKKAGKKALEEFIGKPTPYLSVDVSLGKEKGQIGTSCASGIAYADETVYIMEHGVVAKIPWEMIRSWEWLIEGHAKFAGRGVGASIQATELEAKARDDAYKESGFFIDVADVDKPRRQFMSTDEKTLLRWFEIFRQLKDGSLASS